MFPDPLYLRSKSNGRWELSRPFTYITCKGERIVVPVGATTDLFSIPRLLWWLIPRDRRGREGAVVHDWLYQNPDKHDYTKKEADQIFRNCLQEKEVNVVSRWTMYFAVRLFGRGNWT